MTAKYNNPFDSLRMEENGAASCLSDKFGDIDSKDISVQERERYGQDTRFRKYLAIWVMIIVPAWLAAVCGIVCMCAADIWNLTNVQMTTLLATTTANVLGLAYIILRGLFTVPEKK